VDTVEFVARPSELRIIVKGSDLLDLVWAVEHPGRRRPSRARSYLGLSPGLLVPPSRHFLGEPWDDYHLNGKPYILGCICGTPACSPLAVRIAVESGTVTWSDFEHGFADRSYDELGPFEFGLSQYVRALEHAAPSIAAARRARRARSLDSSS
jgi:hypothetical protein